MKPGLRLLIGIVLAVAAVGSITYFNRSRPSTTGLVSAVERPRAPVRTRTLTREDLTQTIRRTGVLRANRDVILTAEVAGKVLRRHRELGDRCPRNKPLLQIDPGSYRIALIDAEAGHKQAGAQLHQARRDLERTRKLAQRSTVAAQTLERAQTAVRTAVAAAHRAAAAVRLARRNLRLTTIRCPFDGRIAETMVDLGHTVGPQTALARVVDTERLKLQLKVSAAELRHIEAGQPVTVATPRVAGERFTGKVSRIGVAADAMTHTFPVEIEVVPNAAGRPRPGQVVTATVAIAEHQQVVAVPEQALVRRDGRQVLFVVAGAKVRSVAVQLGERIDSRVIITGGVKPGDEVVVLGHDGLRDGDKIERTGEPGGEQAAAAR